MTQETKNPVESPCMSVCALDGKDVCIGCFRTAEEISKWSEMGNFERRQVLKNITERGVAKGAYFGSFQ